MPMAFESLEFLSHSWIGSFLMGLHWYTAESRRNATKVIQQLNRSWLHY